MICAYNDKDGSQDIYMKRVAFIDNIRKIGSNNSCMKKSVGDEVHQRSFCVKYFKTFAVGDE